MGLGSSKPSSVFVISIRTDYIQNKSILKQVPFKPLVYPSEQQKNRLDREDTNSFPYFISGSLTKP